MVKKKKAPSNAAGDEAAAQAALTRGEELIDEDPRAALQCFEEVLRALPTNQTAWCNRGVAAAQLWEEASAVDRRPLLRSAYDSFHKVFTLDTSTRGEARYLSALACGKLLSRAAGALEEEAESMEHGSASTEVIEALTEANQCFEEAFRLQDNYEAFDDECWGAWGEVLAQQMRVDIAAAELRLPRRPGLGASADGSPPLSELLSMESIARLCEAAADKFTRATSAEVGDPEGMDGGDDSRWLTLHVEHLLAFVQFVKKALSIPLPAELPLEAWRSRAEAAWREAVALADASLQLLGAEAGWEAFSLRGDAFATAAELLGALSMRMPEPRLQLPDGQASPSQLSGMWESVGVPSYAAGLAINAADAVAQAEAAYKEAFSRGGQEAAATVGMAVGELRLGYARHLSIRGTFGDLSSAESCTEREACLRAASEAFQTVTSLRGAQVDRDVVASAWYNLACVAGLLNKAEHAAEALRACFKHVQPSNRIEHWANEAREDMDLQSVCVHPQVQQVLARQ